jgi:O-antigen/teichoic acid export membrane protein
VLCEQDAMNTGDDRREVLVRLFGGAVAIQAFLSAVNFLVGLILIRRTANSEYGYFVLASTGIFLVSGLQAAFIQPPLMMRMRRSDRSERADVIGGVYRGQRRILMSLSMTATGLVAILILTGLVGHPMGLLLVATIAAFASALYRGFFRLVLFTHGRANHVQKADLSYGAIVLVGVPLATLSPAPAAGAICVFALAATVAGSLSSRSLWRHEAWNPEAPVSMLREMAPLGKWSALGSAAHWTFSQGYNYIVAATMDVSAIPALAATRLLFTPLNIVSTGISPLMTTTSWAWLGTHGPAALFRRLLLIASVLSGFAICYCIAVWLLRDEIFTQLMHKHFSQGGILVAEWGFVAIAGLYRDQLNFLPGVCGLQRRLLSVTATSAVIALAVGYAAIRRYGVIGGPAGVLVGEVCNLIGILYLSHVEIQRHRNSLSIACVGGRRPGSETPAP